MAMNRSGVPNISRSAGAAYEKARLASSAAKASSWASTTTRTAFVSRGDTGSACAGGAIRVAVANIAAANKNESRLAARIHGVPEGAHLAAQHHLPAEQRCNLTKKDTTKFRRLSRNDLALTLRCGEIFFHPTEDRYLTPREYMRLHGYPDDYVLKGPIRGRSGRVRNLDQHRQIANSVPPPVAKTIGKEILRTIECQKSLKSLATP